MNAIDTLELSITGENGVETRLSACLEHHPNNILLLRFRSSGWIEDRKVEVRSEIPAFARDLAVTVLQVLIDDLGQPPAVVKVIRDSGRLLPTVSYRCSNPECRAKLFESWGSVHGVRIICRKCKTLCTPVQEH